MNVTDLVLLSSGGGLIIAIVSFVIGNNRSESKKHSRIYERIDDERTKSEKEYQTKEVCSIYQKQIFEDLSEMKIDLKKLLYKNNIRGDQ